VPDGVIEEDFSTEDERTVAYWRKALADYPNDRGQVLRSGMEAALREIDRLRYALSQACFDGWADGAGAMAAYLRKADEREREPE